MQSGLCEMALLFKINQVLEELHYTLCVCVWESSESYSLIIFTKRLVMQYK